MSAQDQFHRVKTLCLLFYSNSHFYKSSFFFFLLPRLGLSGCVCFALPSSLAHAASCYVSLPLPFPLLLCTRAHACTHTVGPIGWFSKELMEPCAVALPSTFVDCGVVGTAFIFLICFILTTYRVFSFYSFFNVIPTC